MGNPNRRPTLTVALTTSPITDINEANTTRNSQGDGKKSPPNLQNYQLPRVEAPHTSKIRSACTIMPFPSPKPSNLNAASPSFAYSQNYALEPARIMNPTPKQSSNGSQQLQNPIQPIVPTGLPEQRQHQACSRDLDTLRVCPPYIERRSPGQNAEGLRTSISSGTPQLPHQALAPYPNRAANTFLAKGYKLRKDIVISSLGVQRNIAQVTDIYLPSGASYQTPDTKFEDAKPNFLEILAEMDLKEQASFLRNSNFEIFVDLLSQDDEEAAMKGQLREKQLASSGKDLSSSKLAMASSIPGAPSWETSVSAILAVLKSLPLSILDFTEKLTVTLQFPKLPQEPALQIQTPIGPRNLPPSRRNITRGNSTHAIPKDTSYQKAANFVLMAKIVSEVYRFKALKKLDVVLAPPSNMRTPMTLPQLNCVLPFYDLDFTDWKLWWQTDFMSKPEPLRSWPLDYLNKERDRICFEREQKLRDLVLLKPGAAGKSPRIN